MTNNWKIFKKEMTPHDGIKHLPPAPSWRRFSSTKGEDTEEKKRGSTFQIDDEQLDLVNAAIYLRRPLLVEGKPGTGKSSLAYAIAYQLQLGKVLRWNITTRSTLTEGLYSYDAVGRLQSIKNPSQGFLETNKSKTSDSTSENRETNQQKNNQQDDIGKYIRLGAVGTALIQSKSKEPRVLLIDEIDKSDIDLPNNLLNIFEEGQFDIPELARIKKQQPKVTVFTSENDEVDIEGGKITCEEFPIVILTSNGERDFPPAFLRRCIRLNMPEPSKERLRNIVQAQFENDNQAQSENDNKKIIEKAELIIDKYIKLRDSGDKRQLATDQLLNVIYLVTRDKFPDDNKKNEIINKLLQDISNVL